MTVDTQAGQGTGRQLDSSPFGDHGRVSAGLRPAELARWKLPVFGPVLGIIVGAMAGMVLWMLAWAWGSLNGWEMARPIIEFFSVGGVVGFLLGLPIQLFSHGWKLLTAARQGSKISVKRSAEPEPLGENSGASSTRG
jgi:hypothetical protein